MAHPFTWLPGAYRVPLFGFLFVVTVFFAVMLMRQGKPLQTSAAPAGIVSYEFAWRRNRAEAILHSWDQVRQVARVQLQLDFGYLLVYPLLLALACALLAESPTNQLASVGAFIAWAVLLASPLDAIENLALYRMLDHGASDFLAKLAGWSASLKFLFVYSSLGYIGLQGLSVLIGRCTGTFAPSTGT